MEKAARRMSCRTSVDLVLSERKQCVEVCVAKCSVLAANLEPSRVRNDVTLAIRLYLESASSPAGAGHSCVPRQVLGIESLQTRIRGRTPVEQICNLWSRTHIWVESPGRVPLDSLLPQPTVATVHVLVV